MKLFLSILVLLLSLSGYAQTDVTSVNNENNTAFFNTLIDKAQNDTLESQPFAQRKIAQMYYKGEGTEKNLDKAFEYFKRSADEGIVISNANVAYMSYDGEGTSQDYDSAYTYLKRAMGYETDAKGYFYLGRMYFYGQGTTLDKSKAIYFINKARETSSEYGYQALAQEFWEEHDLGSDE